MYAFRWCDYLGFLFLTYCVVQDDKTLKKQPVTIKPQLEERTLPHKFEVEYQWNYVNFTWPSYAAYRNAINRKVYIPENNALVGIKFYKDKLYTALPRLRPGTPVTLAQVSTNSSSKTNLLLSPFPSWEMNVQEDCATLQNVYSMEIDRRGIMWVLDGTRINNFTSCPPKLVLLDLNNQGKVLQTYEFPNEICSREGGFLNDIVVDESDGGYAYITESSDQDPGIIIYSRMQNRAWKIHDSSMFAELNAVNLTVDGLQSTNAVPVDGIALAPQPSLRNQDRFIFYSALSGLSVYAISNRILKNEDVSRGSAWRSEVQYVGKRQSQSDGFAMDNKGNLYFGLLNTYAIAQWNMYTPFTTTTVIDKNRKAIIWPDSFGFDSKGNLYVLANGINKYHDTNYKLEITDEMKFRILKYYTGTLSYLYN